MSWTVSFVNATAEAEVRSLPEDMIARFLRLGDMIRASGLQRMREPYAKHLTGKLWEMRMSGRDGIRTIDLCCGIRAARHRVTDVCKEDAEDSAA